MKGLGIKQRAVLALMYRHGGAWPPRWRITFAQRKVLDSLCDRGLVTRIEHPTGRTLYQVVQP